MMKKIFSDSVPILSTQTKKLLPSRSYQLYNAIPFEIAIYHVDGRYKFTNKEYIADEKINRQVINQNDNYYAKLVGISSDSLYKRREKFKEVLEKKQAVRFTEKIYFPAEDKTLYYKRIFQPKLSRKKEIKEILLFGSDLTPIFYAQTELKYLVYHDKLTGLKNRQAFLEHLDLLISEEERTRADEFTAILLCDIDNFKQINDMVGHDIGDLFLQEVSNRIQNVVRKSDSIFRLGGDEFGIILKNLVQEHDASRVAKKIIKELTSPYQIDEKTINYLTVSIGIVLFPKDGHEKQVIIKNVTNALKNAKKMGSSNFQFFSDEVTKKSLKRLEMESNLRILVNEQSYEKQFEILYQPVVEKMLSGDYRIIGCEALLRWHNPDLGSISPATFIPIAEETDLICPIGDWVFYRAINDFKSLTNRLQKQLYISINLSARQMKSPDLARSLENVITNSNIDPRELHLELTETSFLDEGLQVIKNIDAIENLGIKIDIDDFGVGFASLKYLQKFPVSTIKIDRSFIQHLNYSSEHKRLVESIIILGKNLNKDIIAEGVENLEHLYMLYTQKCYKYQGFLFSKPINLSKLEKLLEEEKEHQILKSSMGNFLNIETGIDA